MLFLGFEFIYISLVFRKDKIIVKARGNNSSSDTKELTGAELQKDAIKDYELLVEDNNIKITLPSYEKSIYVVVFNKSITKDNNFFYSKQKRKPNAGFLPVPRIITLPQLFSVLLF